MTPFEILSLSIFSKNVFADFVVDRYKRKNRNSHNLELSKFIGKSKNFDAKFSPTLPSSVHQVQILLPSSVPLCQVQSTEFNHFESDQIQRLLWPGHFICLSAVKANSLKSENFVAKFSPPLPSSVPSPPSLSYQNPFTSS